MAPAGASAQIRTAIAIATTTINLAEIAGMRPLLLIASNLQDNVATQCLWDDATATHRSRLTGLSPASEQTTVANDSLNVLSPS